MSEKPTPSCEAATSFKTHVPGMVHVVRCELPPGHEGEHVSTYIDMGFRVVEKRWPNFVTAMT